jgi:hypothetical protein
VGFVQQVVGAFVVDLDEGDLQFVRELLAPASELVEHIGQHSRNRSALLPVVPAAHGEGLPGASLPVGEDGAVVAVEAVVDDGLGDALEDVGLAGFAGEDAVEGEEVVVLGVGELAARYLQLQRSVSHHQAGDSE